MPLHRGSIRFRLTSWYAAVLAGGFALFGGLIWFSLRSRLMVEVDRDLDGRAARFETFFRVESVEAGGDQLRDELSEFCQALPPGSYIDLAGSSGFRFRSAGAPATVAGFRILRRQFAFHDQTFQLETGAPLDGIVHTLVLLRWLLVACIPVVMAVACAGGYWLGGRALKPVRDITAAARTVSIENLSERLPVPATGDELAQLTEVLNGMLGRLEEAVKTLSRFVADASHEFRTPLAVIQASAELALRRPRTVESYRDSLREIQVEVERMTNLVDDLLTLARSDTGACELPVAPLDVREVIGDALAEIAGLAERRETRVVEMLGDAPAIIAGHRASLRRMFLALLDNALKYSPPQGQVTVRLDCGGAGITVAVEDFGFGIRAEDLPNIFKRFYRVDQARSGGGYGLGLPLAESIARAHGATIAVSSTEGVSSTFSVIFPRRGAEPVLPAARQKALTGA